MEIRFTVHGEPKGKGRPRFTKTGHAVTPKDTVIYENLVRMEYLNQCGETKFPDDAIRKSTTLEMKRHLRRKVEEYSAGLIEMEVVTATLKSYLGMLDHCDCKEFRKELIDSVVLDRNKVVGEIAYEVENYSEAMVCGL